MRTNVLRLVLSIFLAAHASVADSAPTVGVYDENVVQPNTVDLLASGSSVGIAQFESDVATAYSHDLGGVIDGSALDTSYTYGVDQNKSLNINGLQFQALTGSPSPSPIPISGTEAFEFNSFATSSRGLSNKFGISNGLRDEQVVEIGLTVLSQTGVNFGTVTLASSGNGFPVATAVIDQPTGEGDTLLVLKAPPGKSFGFFILSYSGTIGPNDHLWFDDLAFVTAQLPEPSTVVLVASGGLALVVCRLRRNRPSPRGCAEPAPRQ
jgi:hypothetical protein